MGSLGLGSAGCLENLNQQKYFETLEAASPALASQVQQHRESIEQQLERSLRAEAFAEVTAIGMWGESWDLVRRVTDGERLFMRGRIFHAEGPASTYYLAFTVDHRGHVVIEDLRVFADRSLP